MAAEVQSAENCYNGSDNQFKAMQMCWPGFDHFYGSGSNYPPSHNSTLGSDSAFQMASFGNAHQLSALAQLNTSMNFPFSPPSITSSPNSSTSSRKKKPKPIPEEQKDQAYFARRHRNNESAKKSREMRRKKEDERERAMKFLEIENQRLRLEIETLKQNILQLQQIHYQAQAQLHATTQIS